MTASSSEPSPDSAVERVLELLGRAEDYTPPPRLVGFLPDEITFPFQSTAESLFYDHRLHLLLQEIVSRIGKDEGYPETLVQNCGHILAQVQLHDDDAAGVRLVRQQATLLADDYLNRAFFDPTVLCWRGELACWEHDYELAMKIARNVWKEFSGDFPATIAKVLCLLALTSEAALDLDDLDWGRHGEPWPHFGGLKANWLDEEECLRQALVRRAYREGRWDTAFLRAVLFFQERGIVALRHTDLSTECWVWLAESGRFEHCGGEEDYYGNWCNALLSLPTAARPELERNCIVVLLAGRLFNWVREPDVPSIQLLLERLAALDSRAPATEKTRAALAMLKYAPDELKLTHLTAADRLAIDRSISEYLHGNADQSRGVNQEATSGTEPESLVLLLGRAEGRLTSE